jgi:hypothetical protein
MDTATKAATEIKRWKIFMINYVGVALDRGLTYSPIFMTGAAMAVLVERSVRGLMGPLVSD